jgi:hypothetical protein
MSRSRVFTFSPVSTAVEVAMLRTSARSNSLESLEIGCEVRELVRFMAGQSITGQDLRLAAFAVCGR